MGEISAATDPGVAAAPTDPALSAVRALVAAAVVPMAVFDAAGFCLAANSGFVLASAGKDAPATAGQRRVGFSPGDGRDWTLATLAEAPGTVPAAGLMEVVATALPVVFDAKDVQGRYVFINRTAAELHGLLPADLLGRTATELWGEALQSQARSVEAGVLHSGQVATFYETSRGGPERGERHWMTSKVPLTGPGGVVWGVATVAVEITERARLEERLREATARAEAGNRAKSRFLSTISHELRTPLNAVIGFAEMMRDEALGPLGAAGYREFASLILRSGVTLLDLITNLVDYARAETGSLELHETDVPIMRLLRSVVAGVQDEAAAVALGALPALEIEPHETEIAARGDELRLRQVLRGLIGNAMKFTPPTGRVSVRARPLPDGGVEIVVADSGIGMTSADMDSAFEPFWQADIGHGRTREGTGIGLNLARQLAALHGGTLALHSVAGQGTQATLRLPRAPPPRAAA